MLTSICLRNNLIILILLIICFTAVAASTESHGTQIVDLQRQAHQTTQNVNQQANAVLGLFFYRIVCLNNTPEEFHFHQVIREFN